MPNPGAQGPLLCTLSIPLARPADPQGALLFAPTSLRGRSAHPAAPSLPCPGACTTRRDLSRRSQSGPRCTPRSAGTPPSRGFHNTQHSGHTAANNTAGQTGTPESQRVGLMVLKTFLGQDADSRLTAFQGYE